MSKRKKNSGPKRTPVPGQSAPRPPIERRPTPLPTTDTPEPPKPRELSGPAPRVWALVGILLLCAFGIFVGGLLTWHHDVQLYGGVQVELLGCVESEKVNCDIVNTSEWSELLGVPLGVWAIIAYGTVAVLAGLGLTGRRGVIAPLIGAGVLAVLGSGVLYYVSIVELQYVCAWCLRLYATNAALLVLAALAGKPARFVDREVLAVTGGAFVALTLLGVGGEAMYRRSLLGAAPEGLQAAVIAPAASDGPAPPLTFTVRTEDGNDATFTLEPDDAWKGNLHATVAVVEFADLQCGYCKRTSSELARLYAAYGDRVLFVFKHFPMNPTCNPGVKNNKHRYACDAAAASVCAQQQGKFWDFHDLAFKNQHKLQDEYLRTYAEKIGLDLGKFDACVGDPATMAVVAKDAEAGAALDIHGTPRIFINGKLYRSGSSAEAMAKEIEIALGATAADAALTAAKLHEDEVAIAIVAGDAPPMQRIDHGGLVFSIDSFEASIEGGAAVVGKRRIPAIRTSWFEAKTACEAAGKRLCSEEEWVTACQGARALDENANGEFADDMIEGTAYPYGDFHEGGRCWDGKEGDARDGEPWRPVYTGEMPGCVTPTGVYDLTGNVEEWVGTTPENAVLLGGAWDTSDDHARCYRRNDTYGAGYKNARTGFRCCSAPP